MKRLVRVAFGLRTGIVLMALLAGYAVLATVLPPAKEDAETASWMLFFGLDKPYSSWVFIVLLALFFIDLLGCTIPSALPRMR